MKLDERRRNVSFWSETIESMHLRVILSPFDKLRVNSVEGSLNTSLHSAPASLRA